MNEIGQVSPFEIGWIWPIIFLAPVLLFFARRARFVEALLWIVSVTMLTQAATADGASMVFTFLFGWIPALFYSLFWFAFWRWTARRTV